MMNRNVRNLFVTGLLLLAAIPAIGQGYSRIRAELTVKVKESNGGQSLTLGEVAYDRNQRQILYHVSFPEKETWVSADTLLYQIRDGALVKKLFSPSMAEFSVFHLALSSHLQNYGLTQTQYKAESVTREGDQVITTWVPPANLKAPLGKILVSTRNKQLYGVIFFDKEGTLLRKQFFEEYQVVSGLAFPMKIVEINIVNGKEAYQVTTFRNVVVDEKGNDDRYFYPVGSFR